MIKKLDDFVLSVMKFTNIQFYNTLFMEETPNPMNYIKL